MTKNQALPRINLVPVDEATRDRLAGCPLIPMSKPNVGEIIRIRVTGHVSSDTYRVLDVMHDVVWTKSKTSDHFDVILNVVVAVA